jgi:hypothetical protein
MSDQLQRPGEPEKRPLEPRARTPLDEFWPKMPAWAQFFPIRRGERIESAKSIKKTLKQMGYNGRQRTKMRKLVQRQLKAQAATSITGVSHE